ncbi:MAG: hypothetical protein ABI239_01190, partial [Aquihabitans sp.]
VRATTKLQANYERSNQVVPGVPSSAPTSWLGSHDPEARMHRRLVEAMKALRANQSFDQDGGLLDLRVELEQQAVAIDAELVATAALPLALRQEPLQTLAGAVETIEHAVAGLATTSAAEVGERLQRVLEDLRFRTSTVAQARAALDEIDAASGDVDQEGQTQPPPATDPGSTPGPMPGSSPS